MTTKNADVLEGSGVYCLIHVPSNRFYIGSSHALDRREQQWFRHLSVAQKWCVGHIWRSGSPLPRPFFTFYWEPREWNFVVLKRLSPDWDLAAEEQNELNCALQTAPDRCLNTFRKAVRNKDKFKCQKR